MNGCEGPQGPQGEILLDTLVIRDTTVVKDTMIIKDTLVVTSYDTLTIYRDTIVKGDTLLMNTKCQRCHNDGQKLPVKQYEWGLSDHAVGDGFSKAKGKSKCTRCHSGSGFIAQVVEGKAKTEIDTLNMCNINCRTCHKIHTNFDSTDWALSTVAKVALYVNQADTISTMGKGNLCINCHQAIYVNPVDTATSDSIMVTSRFGAHYGPQASILIGTGGCESICDTATKPDSSLYAAAHLTNGCVECHVSMVDGKNHAFEPSNGAVTGAVTAINVDTIRAKVDTLMVEVRDSLIALNIIETNSSAAIGVSLVPGKSGTMFAKPVAGACWNYLMIAEDESHGVHNSFYVMWLLENSLAVLKQ